ncbi:hypothetical protein BDN67DRAFT_911516 [Paxillus ammoniavirescens]|nr:hypothetical protein BDN67DRAFT_911516 [Paxillus ammoniavirescens]
MLSPARLHNMDGNMSAKRLDGSGSLDPHVFASSYFISDLEIEQFKDDVCNRPGNSSDCMYSTNNWIAAKSVEEDKVQVFEQTGICLLVCCHGFVECIVEMKHSGELVKYGLTEINQILNICGNDQAIGHDIGCSSRKTVAASSLGMKTKEEKLRVVVNTSHGFAHNHLWQLQNHLLYLTGFASLTRHSSSFHWKQFLDLHFDQWDCDKYLELSHFLYNNCKQALNIISKNTPELDLFKHTNNILDDDFKQWHQEELDYLWSCVAEPDSTTITVQYIEQLQKLQFVE